MPTTSKSKTKKAKTTSGNLNSAMRRARLNALSPLVSRARAQRLTKSDGSKISSSRKSALAKFRQEISSKKKQLKK